MKWIDRNKGDLERPNYRSRLVCREVKRARGAEYIPEHASFSAMPPLEALKLLLSLMVTLKKSRNGSNLKLRLLDISRAHFYGNAERRVFVTLPEGDKMEGHCGLLLKSMYGTRDAANIWQRDYTELLLRHLTSPAAMPGQQYSIIAKKMFVYLSMGTTSSFLQMTKAKRFSRKSLKQGMSYASMAPWGPVRNTRHSRC